ncbi:Orotidine 5'-phosphate decarboxylase / HUMPS family protein [Candidatus Tiddalikarchaeum anstoanum]|nr:Orotidine 5'-phosphate decarboxylase / HUMPS family protein [Candidatus Tiddalikarchaeum anstoanum]
MVQLSEKQLIAAKKVYFAWDSPTLDDAIPILEATRGLLFNVKINSLYIEEGDKAIEKIRSYGMNVFLDLKFYDIPGTVKNFAYAAAKKGVNMFTVHTHGGVSMMKAANDGVTEASEKYELDNLPVIAGVTVLTSFNEKSYLETFKKAVPELSNVVFDDYNRNTEEESISAFKGLISKLNLDNVIKNQVVHLAGLAAKANMGAVVCSPKEVGDIKKLYPSLLTVVPGIQGPVSGIAGSTQNMDRVATPSNAIKWGADYLVIGSAIHKAKDPKQAMLDIINDIAKVI